MGQAKNRGSFERRRAESLMRERPTLGGGLGTPIAAVDPEVLIHLFGVSTSAGLAAVRGEAITADAFSAALDAALAELRTMHVEGKDAYLARLSCVRPVFDSGRFGEHFRQDAQGHVFIGNALLQAMALAPCFTRWNEELAAVTGQFDLVALEQQLRSAG